MSNGSHKVSRVPKGSYSCNGDGRQFPKLNNDTLWESHFFLVAPDVDPLSFTWTFTGAHRTDSWEYFVLTENNALLGCVDGRNSTPPDTVVHKVPLNGYTGRQTILAHWNIGDTEAAFYSCVDLYIEPMADVAANRHMNGSGSANTGPSM